jgi:ribosome recycling factor
MLEEILHDTKNKFEACVEHLNGELALIRTTHTNPALVEDIAVEVYDGTYPLKEISAISVPEPNVILIQVWDHTIIEKIQTAITNSNLGISPAVDGTNIRLVIPPLTEERRKESIKLVNNKAEEAKVSIRNIRQTKMKSLGSLLEESKISEDEHDRYHKSVQELVDKYIEKTEEIQTKKIKTLES